MAFSALKWNEGATGVTESVVEPETMTYPSVTLCLPHKAESINSGGVQYQDPELKEQYVL